MELFKTSKLIVTLSNDNVLSISEKSGCCCSKEEYERIYNLSDIIKMMPDKGGSCVAFTTTNAEDYLEMNKTAVSQLLEQWEAIPKSFTEELLFEKKNLECYITSNGYLIFKSKSKKNWYSLSSTLSLLSISMADVLLKDTHHKLLSKSTFFMSTLDHAIEIENLESEAIERIEEEIEKNGAQISEMMAYKRAFRFSLNRETEYIYTSAKGIAHYYKKNWKKSQFCFTPWDAIKFSAKTKGFFRRKLIIIATNPIYTTCKFPSSHVCDVIDYIDENISDNAGNGTLYGKGSNKVYVTDTHVVCIGNKELKALQKPYEDGEMVKRSWCSSTVNLDGFNVKVGRYAWKRFCCGTGSFYNNVTSTPSRELLDNAQEHRF